MEDDLPAQFHPVRVPSEPLFELYIELDSPIEGFRFELEPIGRRRSERYLPDSYEEMPCCTRVSGHIHY